MPSVCLPLPPPLWILISVNLFGCVSGCVVYELWNIRSPVEPDMCQKYQILWIIKLPVLLKVFTGNICYCSNIWHAQLIRSVSHLNISFSCWFRSIGVPFCAFCSLLNFYRGCQRTRTLWNRCLHSRRSLLRRWWVVTIYHNSQCGDNLEEFETSQQLKCQSFQTINIQIEGTVLYFLRWRLSWHMLNRNCFYIKKHYLAIHSFLKFKMLNQKIQGMVSQHVWTWTPVISAHKFNFQHTSLTNLDMRMSSEQNRKSTFQ